MSVGGVSRLCQSPVRVVGDAGARPAHSRHVARTAACTLRRTLDLRYSQALPLVYLRRASSSRREQACYAALPDGADSADVTAEDRQFMRKAIELASRGLGKTHPNPAVGSIIVKDGKVVGEGFHPKAGMPHAEVYALRGAGNESKGATAYVTLEPCNHFGRTPPCSRALVDAGVKRVVIGVVDPNPLVGGAGIKTLEDAGIQVDLVRGEEEAECFAMNKDFMDRMAAQAAT